MTSGRILVSVARVALARAARRGGTWGLLALALLPPVLGTVLGALGHGATVTALPIAIRLVAPLLVAALVAGPVGEQFERRTVLYYFLRPVSRTAVLAGEWLGYAALVALTLGLAGAFLAVADAFTGAPGLGSLLRIPLALAVEGGVLAGLCLGLAVLVPRQALLATIGVLALTEGGLPALPGNFHYVSLGYHVGQLAGLATEPATGAGLPLWVSGVALLAYGIVPLVVAARVVEERDLV